MVDFGGPPCRTSHYNHRNHCATGNRKCTETGSFWGIVNWKIVWINNAEHLHLSSMSMWWVQTDSGTLSTTLQHSQRSTWSTSGNNRAVLPVFRYSLPPTTHQCQDHPVPRYQKGFQWQSQQGSSQILGCCCYRTVRCPGPLATFEYSTVSLHYFEFYFWDQDFTKKDVQTATTTTNNLLIRLNDYYSQLGPTRVAA